MWGFRRKKKAPSVDYETMASYSRVDVELTRALHERVPSVYDEDGNPLRYRQIHIPLSLARN